VFERDAFRRSRVWHGAEGGTMTVADILHAVESGGGSLPATRFLNTDTTELRDYHRALEAAYAEHDRRAKEHLELVRIHNEHATNHQNAARVCRAAMRSVDTAIGERAA
jgi:hypothetical protein